MTIKQAMEILKPENNRPALPQQHRAFEVVSQHIYELMVVIHNQSVIIDKLKQRDQDSI
jgi:hypothetical protein